MSETAFECALFGPLVVLCAAVSAFTVHYIAVTENLTAYVLAMLAFMAAIAPASCIICFLIWRDVKRSHECR